MTPEHLLALATLLGVLLLIVFAAGAAWANWRWTTRMRAHLEGRRRQLQEFGAYGMADHPYVAGRVQELAMLDDVLSDKRPPAAHLGTLP